MTSKTTPNPCIDPEHVAYWFFRLNGCFTFTNFMLHTQNEANPYTDGDVIAVRFPHRIELDLSNQGAMQDASFFTELVDENIIEVFITEVKYRNMDTTLNRPWRKDKTVLTEFLKRIGVFPLEQIDTISSDLYHDWSYRNETHRVRVCTVAKSIVKTRNPEMPLPVEQQLTWDRDVLPFIFERFSKYNYQKRQNSQWDRGGSDLFRWVGEQWGNEPGFINLVNTAMQEFIYNKNNNKSKGS